MTGPASSCHQLQDRRATGVLLMLLFSVVSVDAAYKGVGTRNQGVTFHCEVRVNTKVKFWVGTYGTEALAALACDVAFFYTNRPSRAFNLEYSEDVILWSCKPRSAYDNLNGWEERERFIRAQAKALINLMSSQNQASDFHWEDVPVPPLVPVRQRSGGVAWTIVEHFRNQAEQLREFMVWLMRLSNAATQLAHKGRVQTVSQQRSEEMISQSDIEEVLPVGGEQFLDVDRVTLLLDSVEARLGGALWLTLIASSLPLLFQMFTKTNTRHIRDASVNANESLFTEQESCQSRAELATKRQKVDQPSNSIDLDPAEKQFGNFDVLQNVDFRDLSRFNTLSNSWKKFIEGEVFRQSRGDNSEGEFTAIYYYIKNKSWRCSGYDLHSRSWRSFPPMSYLPPPDPDLFKEYSVCGHGELMCAEVSKLPKKGELVVFNPLTGETRALPPLLHPRNPVSVHLSVDSAKRSYKVIVAGSSSASDEHLSRKVEVFESSTSKWKEVCDLPGPTFGLNEHQAGVFLNGNLFLISFLESGGRGVVALDVENGTWLQDLTTPIPWSSYSNILQLVESDGRLFVFSEQEIDRFVDHCIDELEFPDPEAGVLACRWRNVVKAKNFGGRGLQVYPEHTCVGFGEGKLCIFNTLSRDGVVYDMREGKKCEDLVPPPANQMGDDNFFSLNPASFTLQPNFSMSADGFGT